MKKTISILIILALVLTTVLVPVSAYAASDSDVSMPKFSKKEGTYTKSVKLTLTAEKGAKIYYTTDGSKPTTKSKVYTEAITIKKTTRVRAIAVKKGVKSKIRSREYTIKVKAPTVAMDVVTKNGTKMRKVVLTPMDSKTTMYYTTDGTKPTKKAKKYTKAIYVDLDDTLRVRSYKSGCTSRTVTVDFAKATHTDRSSHEFTEKVVAPTTSEKGYTLHTCSVCGDSYKDNYTDKLPAEKPGKDEYVNDGGESNTVEESAGFVAGKMVSGEKAEYRPAPNPNADKNTAVEELNELAFFAYGGFRFFDDGIAKNYEDEGRIAKFVTHSDGRTGINVFGWRKGYDSSEITNFGLNLVLEAFYYMTGDREVAKSLWSWIDAKNINGRANSDDFGFRDVTWSNGSGVITMNGINIEVDNSTPGQTVYYFN